MKNLPKYMHRLVLATAILLLFVGTSFAQRRPAGPANKPAAPPTASNDFFGKLEGNQYTNSFFGLLVTVPEGFIVLNRDEIGIFSKATVDIMKSGNARNNKAFDDAINNQAALLMVAEKPPGSEGNSVAEIQVRKQAAGITANMVLAQSVKMMTGSTKAVLTRQLPSTRFGNRSFVGAEFEVEIAGQKLTQQLYITMQRGYAMTIGLTFAAGSDRTSFDGMLSGFKLAVRR